MKSKSLNLIITLLLTLSCQKEKVTNYKYDHSGLYFSGTCSLESLGVGPGPGKGDEIVAKLLDDAYDYLKNLLHWGRSENLGFLDDIYFQPRKLKGKTIADPFHPIWTISKNAVAKIQDDAADFAIKYVIAKMNGEKLLLKSKIIGNMKYTIENTEKAVVLRLKVSMELL